MIKIILIDDEPRQNIRGERIIRQIFDSSGIEVILEKYDFDFSIPMEKSTSSLEALIMKTRPHIIISDNKIGKNESWGQEFIAKMKAILPETLMCLMTREVLRSQQFGLRRPNPDLIIDKGHLGGDETYRNYIMEKITSLISRNSNFDLVWSKNFDEIFSLFKDSRGKRANIEEVISLIEQCLFDRNFNEEKRKVKIDQLVGGRSGSIVMSCRLSGDLSYGVTGVIKISRRYDAIREFQNYNKFVKWVLPYMWRVEVLGTAITDSLGAICYSFAFDGDGTPISTVDLLRSSDGEITKYICETIFNPKGKAWYSEVRSTKQDASQYFQSERFFSKPSQIEEREKKLLSKAKSVFKDNIEFDSEKISFFGYEITRPSRLIFTEDWGDVEECVCHGDLNANNILVNNKKGGIAFIDFQHTGYHNIYRDFVCYESSIRIDWGGELNRDVRQLVADEISVFELTRINYDGYVENIYRIRKAAQDNFPFCDSKSRINTYLISSYIHFSWLATRFSDWTEDGCKRLIIGAISSLITLEKNI